MMRKFLLLAAGVVCFFGGDAQRGGAGAATGSRVSSVSGAPTVSGASAVSRASSRPNIILFLCDDLGYGDLGAYGQTLVRTPHIDSLARGGMRFRNYYAGCSVCAPSREALLTGRHTGHTYIRGNFLTDSKEDPPMPDSTRTVAELLRAAGYRTALIGKWGLGGEAHGPEKQGFDYSFGYLDQIHAHNYYPTWLYENGHRYPIDENKDSARRVLSEDLFISRTLDYLGKADGSQPFFLYLPYTFPHGEYNIPVDTPFANTDWPKQFKVYATMVTRLDSYIGRIRQLLREKGLADNTVFLFTSDNGANMGFAKFLHSNGELSGSKFGLYEGGIRVPLIAYWKGKIAAGSTADLPAAAYDLMPTICEAAGIKAPTGIDGISILPTLGARRQTVVHDYLYWELYTYNYNWDKPGMTQPRNWLESVALRMGKWKAIKKDLLTHKDAPIELYDLDADPGEVSNVAAAHPEIIRRAAELFASCSIGNAPYFPYQPSKIQP
jgi:arylsulfatase A